MKPNLIELVTDKGHQIFVNLNFVKSITIIEKATAKGNRNSMEITMTDGTSYVVKSEAYVQKLTLAIKGFIV